MNHRIESMKPSASMVLMARASPGGVRHQSGRGRAGLSHT